MKLPRLALLLGLLPAALHAEPAFTLGAAQLRAQPFGDAAVSASLPADAPVDIVARQGGWYQVKAGAQTGWVRLSSVRLPSTAGKGNALAYLGTGRAGATGSTATTGVRGLSESDIANAQPNFAALDQVETWRSNGNDANTFAASANLRSQQVADLQAGAP